MRSRGLRWTLGVVAAAAALVAIRVASALFVTPSPSAPPVATHGGDVYGDPLPQGAVARLGTVRFRAKGPAVWAPDGEHLLVGAWNDEILAMNAKTGLVDWTLPGHSQPFMRNVDLTDFDETWRVIRRGELPVESDLLSGLTMFPDGRRLLSQGYSLRVWDLPSRTETKRIPVRGGNVCDARISPDGTLCAFPWVDCVRIVDLVAGRERRMQHVGADKVMVHCVAWSADGERVFAGLDDGRVAVVPKRGGTPVSFPLSNVAIDALLVADEGRALWTLDHKGVLAIRSLASPNVAARRIDLGVDDEDKKPWWRETMTASPDGRVVAVSSGRRGFRRFDAATAAPVDGPPLEGLSSPIGWSPDGRRFAAWTNGAVHVVGGDAPPQPDAVSGRFTAAAWSPDGRRVATASTNWPFTSQVCAWDADTGRRLWSMDGDSVSWIGSVAWSADGAQVVASFSSRIVGIDAATGARRWTYDVPSKRAIAPTLDVRGEGAMWVDEERDLHFVDLRGGRRDVGVAHLGTKPVTAMPPGALLPDLAGAVLAEDVPTEISADGKSWTSRGFVRVWRIGASAPATAIETPVQGVVAVSRDGRLVAVGHWPVVVFDLAATPPRELGRLLFHRDEDARGSWGLASAAFSADGALLALGDYVGDIHVFSIASLAEVKTLRGHRAQITSLLFSDDGARLVSGSVDATALVWSLR